MRGSLRDLALGSLGRIDDVLIAEHPFRETGLLADDAQAEAAPLLLTQGSALYRADDGEVRRAAQLQVLGVNDEFWKLAEPPMAPPIERGNQIALTADVAKELGVKVGDAVLLRIPIVESIPADSTLGEKEETAATRRLTVVAILDADADVNASLARFALRPNQTAPRNAFVPLTMMQSLLDLPGQANALAVSGDAISADELRPTLADFGITVKEISLGDGTPKYLQIAADRLVLPPDFVALADKLDGKQGLQPVVTYLANRISAGDRRVPYSTVAGVDSTAALGPVVDDAGQPIELADDEVAINDWLASELNVKVGDEVTFLWYDPETTHGELREHKPLSLKGQCCRSKMGKAAPPPPPIPTSPPNSPASPTKRRLTTGNSRSTWSKRSATKTKSIGTTTARRQRRSSLTRWPRNSGAPAGEPTASSACGLAAISPPSR
jgi:hypothetical protein